MGFARQAPRSHQSPDSQVDLATEYSWSVAVTQGAVVLFSGGIDSAVVLAEALARGKTCLALSFFYQQKHACELNAARYLAAHFQVEHQIVSLPAHPPPPADRNRERQRSPWYIPARNTLFLSVALGIAEQIEATEIHFGAHQDDRDSFPDCTPEFFRAFQQLIDVQSTSHIAPQIITPLLFLTKNDILSRALQYEIPLDKTWSCYEPTAEGSPCGECDSCLLRSRALSHLNGSICP